MFNAELPDETRAALLRASDDGDLSPSETATVARKLDEPGNGDVLRTIRGLDETEQRRALKLVAETDDDGIRLLDEVDDGSLQKLLDSDAIETGDLVAATRKYADLDSGKRSQFRELLADDDLRESWVDVAGDSEITDVDIETALARVDTNSEHTVTDFEIGRDANPTDAAHPPHDPDSIVVELELNEGDEFWRVYERKPESSNPDENLPGGFVARRSTLESADSPEEVLDRLALLRSDWQDYNHVGKVAVTDEFVENNQIRVQVSTTRPQVSDVSDEVRPGRATQYILQDDLDPDAQGITWKAIEELDSFVD
ncbi:hypothetical protein [Halosimplex pelagicum]|uniref:Uncharacterized protein n=1 Tax=Halosimplex pelagicum TaxID=869886 RepID=A0A7D5T248_9EURY|nr:hypothetical protein [Halosimplex pelagicum]QLH80891.1 hypothetical protein HZS54_04215 [Halosimplex pelagicum]